MVLDKDAWHLLQQRSSHPCRKKRSKNGAHTESKIVDSVQACAAEEVESKLWTSWLWKAVSGGIIVE